MSRYRQSLKPSHSWGLAGVRTAALLTLILGVVGGLYVSDQKAKQDSAKALDAQQAQQVDLSAALISSSQQKNQVRRVEAADLAAEKAKQAKEDAAQAAAEAARKKAEEQASRSSRPTGSPAPFGPIPASCNVYAGNRAIGCALVLAAGMDMQQMVCLEHLWTRESGWNAHATNSSSGAYGIPQALPGIKMATFGADWRDNPATQIKWGLSYIKGRYGNPCGAWSFFQSHNWY